MSDDRYGPDGHGPPPSKDDQKVVDEFFTYPRPTDQDPDNETTDERGRHRRGRG